MDGELTQTEIKKFIASNGLDLEVLDEREETLESWRLKWEDLAKGFLNYLQDRFTAIEQRLEPIEEERYGHQKDCESVRKRISGGGRVPKHGIGGLEAKIETHPKPAVA
jgi:predicted transcriptional regulator